MSLKVPFDYGHFSGHYTALPVRRFLDQRPVYKERGAEGSGIFHYCPKEEAWLFTIKPLEECGTAFPKSTRDDCEGWIMKSEKTTVFM